MAAAQNNRQIEQIPEFTSPAKKNDQGAARKVTFRFDGETYTLSRPKMVITINMLRIKDGEESLAAGWDTIQLLASMISYIDEEPASEDGKPRGRARLMERLSDRDDPLDLPDLAGPFMELMDRVFKRPTTQPAASSKRPARSSRAGAAGTPTKRARTSTT